ncbi:Macrolide export protein MacA [Aquimixticola soesokkakensis]|uniref:Macrolide export protein MacA n=1 Tax=Aquimixticola soesokkakensis TaxID=1519096 RepID=A0A1Y5T477_9RHOB|nr:efflux RND transporter periplasmic adaptor subunit [Aquimixticola soesokkakensis]SLN55412.1 Macrolide export protein MacA [Aquimixticola soesokkakensis]
MPTFSLSRGAVAFVLVGLLAPLPAVLLPASAAAEDAQKPASQSSARIPTVTTAQAQPRDLVARVPVTGSLVARGEVLVYPDTGGYAVTALEADIGDSVAKGDVLATLDARTLTQKLAQAQAELARAQAAARQAESQVISAQSARTQAAQTLSRSQSLRDSGATTQSALDDALTADQTAQATLQNAQDGVAVAQAQTQQAEVALAIARQDLDAAQIKAPASGIISARNGQIGGIASASGEPLYRIIRDGEVEVEVEVTETDLAQLAVGQRATLDIAGLAPVEGRLRRLAPVVDATSRLGAVRIATPAQAGLRPGLFVGGWITTAERNSLAVPATAVISDARGDYVLLVRESAQTPGVGTLERRDVTAGLLWQDWREITDGLSAGDVVLARAGAFFAPGDTVRSAAESAQDSGPTTGAAAADQTADAGSAQ